MALPYPFAEASAEFQKNPEPGSVFPLLLVPAEGANDLAAVADALQLHRDWLDTQLVKNGAILLRGFPVSSSEDFNTLVEAVGWDEFEYIRGGGLAIRTRIHGKVLSVNENIPLDNYIGFHNEATYLEKPPTRLMFFCEEPPPAGAGGATPLLFGNAVYQRVMNEPELAEQLVNKGPVTIVNVLSREEWQKQFGTDDKQVIEEKIKKISGGLKPEWMDDGGLKLPFSRFGTEVFKEDRAGRMALYGPWGFMVNAFNVDFQLANGTKVPPETMDKLVEIMREEEVSFPWEKGDIVLVDNSAVQHSRLPCTATTTRLMRISLTM